MPMPLLQPLTALKLLDARRASSSQGLVERYNGKVKRLAAAL